MDGMIAMVPSRKSFQITFRGCRLDIRAHRLKDADDWSARVVISHATASEEVNVSRRFSNRRDAYLAGFEAGLARVDELHGSTCADAEVIIRGKVAP